jgi:cytochrome b pre-mRNA-processing protein 3
MILRPFRRNSKSDSIAALYGAIVAQGRSPTFYVEFGVPDTVEGRFDLIVLHLVLVLRRLGGAGDRRDRGGDFGQRLFDAFCRDLDGNLREMGIGDLAVPKRMRRFGEAFYGRQAAYLAALAAGDPQVFENALARNILQGEGIDHRAARLACYARAAARQLDAQSETDLFAGVADFPDPEAFADAPA